MKTKFQIKSIYGNLLFEYEDETLKDAVEAAVQVCADLRSADLSGADLRSADLSGANLYGANLSGADLRSANLRSANLRSANLRSANLRSANLYGADLRSANLSGANLYGANLRSANLSGADLRSADLSGADLRSADLSGADLSGADLRSADLSGADLSGAKGVLPIVPEEGSFIGFKKLANDTIAKLYIPEDAERVGGYTGRKCRASKAIVIEGSGPSKYDSSFTYEPGKTVIPAAWDNDPRVECSSGIHFFITRKEAEEYE